MPNLPLDREATRAALGFERTQEPVTAVQLSRGKAEAALVFEIAVMLGDLGPAGVRPAAFLHERIRLRRAAARDDDRLVDHAAEAQSRRVRARARRPGDRAGALQESFGITAKLTSGYHRDLQRLKAPLFRSIDLAIDVLAIMAHALPSVRFQPREDRARAGALRGRAGQRARRQGRAAVSRGVSARRRAARAQRRVMT